MVSRISMEIPDFLKEKLLSYYPNNIVLKIIEGYKENKYVTLRINTVKSDKLEVTNILKKEMKKVSLLSIL